VTMNPDTFARVAEMQRQARAALPKPSVRFTEADKELLAAAVSKLKLKEVN
jgi:hypothetical protein